MPDDGRPDPRFAATTEELTRQNITDFQLHYAVQTLARLGRTPTPARVAAASGRRSGSR